MKSIPKQFTFAGSIAQFFIAALIVVFCLTSEVYANEGFEGTETTIIRIPIVGKKIKITRTGKKINVECEMCHQAYSSTENVEVECNIAEQRCFSQRKSRENMEGLISRYGKLEKNRHLTEIFPKYHYDLKEGQKLQWSPNTYLESRKYGLTLIDKESGNALIVFPEKTVILKDQSGTPALLYSDGLVKLGSKD